MPPIPLCEALAVRPCYPLCGCLWGRFAPVRAYLMQAARRG
nr:MAG TPA: hypothetical protein [Caudoviricetes sp.]